MSVCTLDILGKRRKFWTNQLTRTSEHKCNIDCIDPGLELYHPDAVSDDVSFRAEDWVMSLALNILLTNARYEDDKCGRPAGGMGGFWADTFSGIGSGSTIRLVPAQTRIADSVNLIKAYALRDLQKMITYGVATEVTVDVTYTGSNKVLLNATIYGVGGGTHNVGIVGERTENDWLWQ